MERGEISAKLLEMERDYLDKIRFYNFWFQISRLSAANVPGDFAEVGVYRGDTAEILHYMDENRTIHLFDTFSGFTSDDLAYEKTVGGRYTTQEFSDTKLANVRKRFHDKNNFIFHSGEFNDTCHDVKEHQFSLVHLDVDLYKPTIEGLEFFYPRLSPKGVIFIHDYNHNWEGVERAIDQFKKTIQEPIIELTDMHGTALLIKET
jgi:O-methyltransferase